ncbi:MAG TPA: PLD nuclease N-terminal domain-containing protein [Thermomicrobiales bacterium]|nr:PLD nuclease N-terminal domain-containing protein [Thermomicrobiales bacterium]
MSVQTIALTVAVLAFGAAQYTLVVQAIRDLMRRPRVRGGNKMSWALLILCVPILGALAYGWLGPTSFLQARSATRREQQPAQQDPIIAYMSDLPETRPPNVTPLRPRKSDAISGRMPAQRPGLTRSRAHNTAGTVSRMRRPGA